MEKTARGFERLPKSIVPINYEITIKPDLVALVFEGSESISLKVSVFFSHVSHLFNVCAVGICLALVFFVLQVVEPVSEIVLNSLDLELSGVKVVPENGQEIAVEDVKLDVENEKAVFTLPSVLQPGQITLKLSFKGVIIDKLKGFYCSKYVT